MCILDPSPPFLPGHYAQVTFTWLGAVPLTACKSVNVCVSVSQVFNHSPTWSLHSGKGLGVEVPLTALHVSLSVSECVSVSLPPVCFCSVSVSLYVSVVCLYLSALPPPPHPHLVTTHRWPSPGWRWYLLLHVSLSVSEYMSVSQCPPPLHAAHDGGWYLTCHCM